MNLNLLYSNSLAYASEKGITSLMYWFTCIITVDFKGTKLHLHDRGMFFCSQFLWTLLKNKK